MGGWTEKDSAERDGISEGEVKRTWHQARDDAASEGSLNERNNNKTNDSEEGSILNNIFSLFRPNKKDPWGW